MVLFLYAFVISANTYTLVPVSEPPEPPPEPTAFGTVTGTAGLNSETLQGGDITVTAGNFYAYADLGSSGTFSLQVSVDDPFSIDANLRYKDLSQDKDLPQVNINLDNNAALFQGEIRDFDLTHPSGRLLTRVILLNDIGTLQNINLTASSSTINNDLTEIFTANDSAGRVNNQDPEILFAMPSDIITTLTGNIKATNLNGCLVSLGLAKREITINEPSTSTNTDPDILEWTVDLSNDTTTCPTANATISGEFRLEGLDSIDLFSEHTLEFFGPESEYRNLKFTSFGSYTTDLVIEGYYGTSENSKFANPYTSLRLPSTAINVLGNTNYDRIHSVGTSHGNVELTGDWGYADIDSVEINAFGSEPGNTINSMSAKDSIDLDTGNFDFILAVGNWDANQYLFEFKRVTTLTNRTYEQSLDFNVQSDIFNTRHVIVKALPTNLTPLSLQTASAEVVLLVEQPAGETVKINRLDINGTGTLLDSSATTIAKSTINFSSDGTAESAFTVTLHGLAGTYPMTAKGTGSDGRDYEVSFDITLGDTGPTDPGGDEDSMACYVINKVKLHRHQKANKDKLHIKYAGFRLPEDAMVDLAEDDVSISVDGMVYDFPAGTFKQKGNKYHYEYKSASGEQPQIRVSINFEKLKWSLKVNHADIDEVDNSDGIDISLSIGNYLGTENVLLESKNKHHDKLMYKRKPKASCQLSKNHKDEDDDDD